MHLHLQQLSAIFQLHPCQHISVVDAKLVLKINSHTHSHPLSQHNFHVLQHYFGNGATNFALMCCTLISLRAQRLTKQRICSTAQFFIKHGAFNASISDGGAREARGSQVAAYLQQILCVD